MGPPAAEVTEFPIVPREDVKDFDRDALHILPLAIVPLRTAALRRARLIKNARLAAVVEFFHNSNSGSGQIEIGSLAREFAWPESPPHPDLVLMRKLGGLPSYDVYSLRILLRASGIPVNDQSALRLSASKVKELTSYMMTFTRPLIQEIYGDQDVSIRSFDDVVALFRSPDARKVRERLQMMAEKLGIEITQIPAFLENYGDIFLSLSYYRQCLDATVPAIEDFLSSLSELRKSHQCRSDPNLMATCAMMESTVNGLLANITGRFENFDRSTNDMWQNLTAERFRRVEALIQSYHTTIGGVLCALSVKMNAWRKLFPNATAGGVGRRAEFLMSEMRQGIDRIQIIEDSAPMLSAVG